MAEGPHRAELFEDLLVTRRHTCCQIELILSLLAHASALALVSLVPLLARERLPEPSQATLRALLLYDPPPPPPPPLGGPGLLPRAVRPTARDPAPKSAPELVAPTTPAVSSESERAEPRSEPAGGDLVGSPSGDPLGMPGGIEGGVVGGVPGGVLGGVVGGAGTGAAPAPMRSPDRPARLLRMTRPSYPHEAISARIQGIVLLEILIDEQGRVASARVLQSVPPLDQAAVETVRSWLFVPAIHAGRPVPSLAQAPITFRIY